MGKQNSKLTQEQVTELQKITKFDKRELQNWYQNFINECPSGQLDRTDFKKIYKQFFPFGDPSTFADYAFNVFDDNKNGSIDFKEFIAAISITARGEIDEKLEWAFKLYDIDNDGYITREEMLKIVDAIYKMVDTIVNMPEDESTPELRVDKIFKSMDRNHDDKLTLAEFKEGAKKDPSILKALNIYDGLV
ncbi:putative FRQ1-regulator of phosphatidylinositol-4-OH kinase protein [Conidiobolus coronatus NRRL 28638]|uniref:Calcium-binding protein NCS-1 n=1 Tax=Conidiobolus coronatus (strain ATCC 28846 / CBS 209.66 / NRRL 28638) TaxID=796925 RepID=A0A137NW20_CONC2|nr:putative FRQ1-regulator of phosphatidylinositol-4-OH kinase protein [Conidiobolus coronatus NRRL 28638]|eukprot:KXN66966.1 putative FRQ1-regulator of phosphatidylinositol-4-OH kinase protein [Conidiobolus coronatus NRRL 28638]